jgi:uncharacterized protein with PIN domain
LPNAEPASVLDASALMALMHDEDGSSVVIDAIAAGTAISVANWAEVLTKAAADGDDPQAVAERVRDTEFADTALRIEPITEARTSHTPAEFAAAWREGKIEDTPQNARDAIEALALREATQPAATAAEVRSPTRLVDKARGTTGCSGQDSGEI